MIRPSSILVAGAVALVSANLTYAVTAAVSVPPSRASSNSAPITANDLKPQECSGILVTDIAYGTGGLGNDLVLGTASDDVLTGDLGDDCIVAGAGNDAIDGGLLGTDVCLGSDGTDSFTECESTYQ